MLNRMERLQNLENLREYVNKVLCQHDQLEFGAFRMTERILVRGRKTVRHFLLPAWTAIGKSDGHLGNRSGTQFCSTARPVNGSTERGSRRLRRLPSARPSQMFRIPGRHLYFLGP